ncbi:MAG: hypothetical protein IT388_00620 [Nitrospirales bacterium]|nr:hypothetical protein [Nitrospirales bacterium]
MKKESEKPFAGRKEEWLCAQIEELYQRVQVPCTANEITCARLYGTFLGTVGTLLLEGEQGEETRRVLREVIRAVQTTPKGKEWRYAFACSIINAVLARLSEQLREGRSLEELSIQAAQSSPVGHASTEVHTLLLTGESHR